VDATHRGVFAFLVKDTAGYVFYCYKSFVTGYSSQVSFIELDNTKPLVHFGWYSLQTIEILEAYCTMRKEFVTNMGENHHHDHHHHQEQYFVSSHTLHNIRLCTSLRPSLAFESAVMCSHFMPIN